MNIWPKPGQSAFLTLRGSHVTQSKPMKFYSGTFWNSQEGNLRFWCSWNSEAKSLGMLGAPCGAACRRMGQSRKQQSQKGYLLMHCLSSYFLLSWFILELLGTKSISNPSQTHTLFYMLVHDSRFCLFAPERVLSINMRWWRSMGVETGSWSQHFSQV